MVVDERLRASAGRLAGRRVAVTGGGGFIGSHVLTALEAACAEVVVVSATSTTLVDQLAGTAAVIHLDYRPPSGGDPLMGELANNIPPLMAVMAAARVAGVGHVCFASSTSVYGAGLGVGEEAAPAPHPTPYAAAKLQQEALLLGWARRFRRRVTILRLSTVYGPGEKARRAIPLFIQAALRRRAPRVSGRGLGPFDPIFVGDVAEAFLAALASEGEERAIYNIGTGVARPPIDVAGLVVRLAGSALAPVCDLSQADRARPVCDCELAARSLGFRAQTPIETGLRAEIEWMRAERR